MKRNITTIIIALVALVAGYGLGAMTGTKVDSEQTSGDVNRANTYNQLLLSPENMVFNEANAGNADLQKKTLESLEIISSQSKEFKTIAVCVKDISQPEMDKEIQEIIKLAKDVSVAESVRKAQDAAEKIADGEKVNYKSALKSAQTAYDGLEMQMKAGHAFVQAADAFLAGKDVNEYRYIAAVRDMFAGCCGTDATLCANDAEIDYWSNINDLLTPQDMAAAIMGE